MKSMNRRRSGKRNGRSIKDTGSDTRVRNERGGGGGLPGSLDGAREKTWKRNDKTGILF